MGHYRAFILERHLATIDEALCRIANDRAAFEATHNKIET